MQSFNVSKVAILALALACTVFTIWNAEDEAVLLGGASGVLLVVFFWLLVPYLVALVGIFSKSPDKTRVSLYLSAVYAVFFLHYALNGSTRDRGSMGAEHMHLILVPFVVPIISLFVLCVLYLLRLARRSDAWLRSGRGKDASDR